MFRKREQVHWLRFYCYKRVAWQAAIGLAAQSNYEIEILDTQTTRIFDKRTRRITRYVD